VVLRLLQLFPQCQHLCLAENPIGRVEAECQGPAGCVMRTRELAGGLRSLVLTQSRLADWKCVDLLGQLPLLESLRLRHVPLLEGLSEEERFHLVVSRL